MKADVKATGFWLRYNYIGNCVNKLYSAKVVLPFTIIPKVPNKPDQLHKQKQRNPIVFYCCLKNMTS